MKSTLDGVPAIPGLVLLAESGRDAIARRFRVEANRPVLLYYFDTGLDPAPILKTAETYAAIAATGFARVLRGFEHGGWAGVLIETDRGDDPFEAPPIGEDATLLRIRPLVGGWLALRDAGIEHGRLARAVTAQPDGSLLALPPFCVPAPEAGARGAEARDAIALVDLAIHAVSGARLGANGEIPAAFTTLASPRLLSSLRQVLDAVNSGSEITETIAKSYLAPRTGAVKDSRAVLAVEADRSQRRLVLTAVALAAPLVVVFVMGLGGGLDRTLGFLRFEDRPVEELPYTPPHRVTEAPSRPADAGAAVVPKVEDSEELRKRGEEILAQIRKTVKPAPSAAGRDPELVAAERLQAEAAKIITDVHEKKVSASQRNSLLQQAIEKLESAREKLENLAEQKPSLARQLEVAQQDLNQLIKSAISLKTRE